ncbi:hypothetical protein ACFL0H_12125, partial [Thermodesulfobacteriota bacterium]
TVKDKTTSMIPILSIHLFIFVTSFGFYAFKSVVLGGKRSSRVYGTFKSRLASSQRPTTDCPSLRYRLSVYNLLPFHCFPQDWRVIKYHMAK